MTPNQITRSATAGMLSGLAKVMAVGSQLTEKAADRLRRPDDEPEPGPATSKPTTADDVLEDVGEARETEAAQRAVVTEPPTVPSLEGPSHVRTHETHVEELAARSAADVVAAIPELSTDELGRLYEHESANKKRKTVLQAIERAADPSAQHSSV